MAETYCGKSCAMCSEKEQQRCPGCKVGPGQRFEGDCEIAGCVRSKGHESCGSCGFQSTCGLFRGRDRAAEYRRKREDVARQQRQVAAARAPVVARSMQILFWLLVLTTVAGLVNNDTVAGYAPGLYWAGRLLCIALTAAYGLVLLRLEAEEDRYKTAGICTLASCGVNLLSALLGNYPGVRILVTLLAIPVAIAAMVGVYYEFTAHAIVLTGIDEAMSQNWEGLRKWYIGLRCAVVACVFVILIAPLLGLFAALVAAIGTLAVSILQLVYLHRSAQLCRNAANWME